ncbi:MAG: threonine--tRNA ligase [Legionellales bacterium]|nr:threonine--tRNA ligase [Legionellales bacterium]
MPVITLPDGSQQHHSSAVTPLAVAEKIGEGLARAALAAKVNNELVDVNSLITTDATVAIITAKQPEGLEVLRHSCAHLMAHAVKQLYPTAQVTIGPVIEDGFYYDFSFERSFTPDDIQKIEAKMQALAKADIPVSRKVVSREEAIAFFKAQGELYKVDIIEAIPEHENLSLYEQGDFVDLCRGPHVPSTGKLKAFKLTKHAGSYWRGDSNNEMLQRIYGTAWANKEDLDAYLLRIEEAQKRDHRKIGKELNLFHLQEESPGQIFWHPDGFTIYRALEEYMRQKCQEYGYQEVRTPIMADKILWEKSGHLEKFGENMFMTTTENHDYAIKPMSCPFHIQIFNQGLKSYRDLPLRLSEFGHCHRCEPSGALHGIMRVRGFIQDDGHIFCTPEQIQAEVTKFNQLLVDVYHDFGFDDIIVLLSTRPEKRVGSDDLWDRAERDLTNALTETGMTFDFNPGEGAFYGPKIEYSLKDSLGRIWQLGTLQLDYCLPERLGAQYVAEDGSRQIPVMLHRAIFGTFERFMGILIEHYAGKFPTWLAPTQVSVLSITDNQHAYCEKIAKILKKRGFRVKTDLRNEKVGFKIREHTLQRIPYLLVIGDKELASERVTVRSRAGEDLGNMALEEFVTHLHQDLAQRGRTKLV